jgi:hypothetical protein
LDSLDWSKKYEVLSISRLSLRSLGFTNEGISSLSDEDMQRIAEKLNNDYFIGFEEDVKFTVSRELYEKTSAVPVFTQENEACVMCGEKAAWCLLGFHYCHGCLPKKEE